MQQAQQASNHRLPLTVCLIYIVLLVYGTLYPLTGWVWDTQIPYQLFSLYWPEQTSRTDIITNLLVYIPLGVFLALMQSRKTNTMLVIIVITVTGTALSFCLEYLQTFLPNRVTSLVDVGLNGLGTLLGASFTLLIGRNTNFKQALDGYKHRNLVDSGLTNIGIFCIAMWALSQLLPLVPSIDVANLKLGLKPLWLVISDLNRFKFWQFYFYICSFCALGLIFRSMLINHFSNIVLFYVFTFTILLLKVPVLGRQLSLEALSALIVSIIALEILRMNKRNSIVYIAAFLLIAAVFLEGLHSGTGTVTHDINWLPFLGQMANLTGLADIAYSIWLFTALGYTIMSINNKHSLWLGAILVCAVTLTIEWAQQSLPGRYPDITDVVVATTAYIATALYARNHKPHSIVAK